MLLVASETGHVYTFATEKLQPMITSEAGKSLIQSCLSYNQDDGDPNGTSMGDNRISIENFSNEEFDDDYDEEDDEDEDGEYDDLNNESDPSDFYETTQQQPQQHQRHVVDSNNYNDNELNTDTKVFNLKIFFYII
jgi:hypothetical protein